MDRPASPAAAAPVVLQSAEAVLRAYWVDGLFWDNEIPAELELSSSVPYDHPAAVSRKWFTARYRDPRVEADYKRFLYLRVAANRWAPIAFLYFALVIAAMAAAYQDVVIGIGAGIIIVGAISIVARRQYIAAVIARLAPHEAAAEMSHSPLPYVDAATFNAQTASIHHTQIFARIEQRLEAQATISDEVEIFYAVVVVLTWLLSAYHATHVNRNACDGHMEYYCGGGVSILAVAGPIVGVALSSMRMFVLAPLLLGSLVATVGGFFFNDETSPVNSLPAALSLSFSVVVGFLFICLGAAKERRQRRGFDVLIRHAASRRVAALERCRAMRVAQACLPDPFVPLLGGATSLQALNRHIDVRDAAVAIVQPMEFTAATAELIPNHRVAVLQQLQRAMLRTCDHHGVSRPVCIGDSFVLSSPLNLPSTERGGIPSSLGDHCMRLVRCAHEFALRPFSARELLSEAAYVAANVRTFSAEVSNRRRQAQIRSGAHPALYERRLDDIEPPIVDGPPPAATGILIWHRGGVAVGSLRHGLIARDGMALVPNCTGEGFDHARAALSVAKRGEVRVTESVTRLCTGAFGPSGGARDWTVLTASPTANLAMPVFPSLMSSGGGGSSSRSILCFEPRPEKDADGPVLFDVVERPRLHLPAVRRGRMDELGSYHNDAESSSDEHSGMGAQLTSMDGIPSAPYVFSSPKRPKALGAAALQVFAVSASTALKESISPLPPPYSPRRLVELARAQMDDALLYDSIALTALALALVTLLGAEAAATSQDINSKRLYMPLAMGIIAIALLCCFVVVELVRRTVKESDSIKLDACRHDESWPLGDSTLSLRERAQPPSDLRCAASSVLTRVLICLPLLGGMLRGSPVFCVDPGPLVAAVAALGAVRFPAPWYASITTSVVTLTLLVTTLALYLVPRDGDVHTSFISPIAFACVYVVYAEVIGHLHLREVDAIVERCSAQELLLRSQRDVACNVIATSMPGEFADLVFSRLRGPNKPNDAASSGAGAELQCWSDIIQAREDDDRQLSDVAQALALDPAGELLRQIIDPSLSNRTPRIRFYETLFYSAEFPSTAVLRVRVLDSGAQTIARLIMGLIDDRLQRQRRLQSLCAADPRAKQSGRTGVRRDSAFHDVTAIEMSPLAGPAAGAAADRDRLGTGLRIGWVLGDDALVCSPWSNDDHVVTQATHELVELASRLASTGLAGECAIALCAGVALVSVVQSGAKINTRISGPVVNEADAMIAAAPVGSGSFAYASAGFRRIHTPLDTNGLSSVIKAINDAASPPGSPLYLSLRRNVPPPDASAEPSEMMTSDGTSDMDLVDTLSSTTRGGISQRSQFDVPMLELDMAVREQLALAQRIRKKQAQKRKANPLRGLSENPDVFGPPVPWALRGVGIVSVSLVLEALEPI
jgi:hypothetical protein